MVLEAAGLASAVREHSQERLDRPEHVREVHARLLDTVDERLAVHGSVPGTILHN